MKILTFADYYLPGFKAGGPIRTISAMVSTLPQHLEFLIVTRDRDHTDHEPFPGVRPNEWTNVGRAKVLYLPKRDLSLARLMLLVHTVKPDVLYANSLFSRISIRLLVARRLGMLGTAPMVLAPRGEFSPGALRIRKRRKGVFLALATSLGFFHDLIWQASTERERDHIIVALGDRQSIRISRNIAVAQDIFNHDSHSKLPVTCKRTGVARFIFLSRVSPMKNLRMAIDLVGSLAGEVSLDIFGPADDEKYKTECLASASAVPANVKVRWHGNVKPAEVVSVIAGFDFLILPTLGENFGHVILEALCAGCPVLLSDRTPWKKLEGDGAGWVLPLEEPSRWKDVLQRCVEMDDSRYQEMSQHATAVAQEYAERESAIRQNVSLFEEAAQRRQAAH
jgi:glycosyltransferase involved in cell wall biosynthesis